MRQIVALVLLGCFPASGPAWAATQQSTSSTTQQTTAQPPGALPGQGASRGQAASQQGKDTSEEELRALRQVEENYLRAEMEDNAQLAASLIADDYIGVIGNGGTSDKLAVLDRLAQHLRTRQPYRITAVNMEEHLFGDMACVTYTKIYTQPNSQATYSENVLHILTKRNGVWRLQVSSPIPAPKP